MSITTRRSAASLAAAGVLLCACTRDLATDPSLVTAKTVATASGTSGGGGGTVRVDQIKVSKCYTNATTTSGGQMLIKAASSDASATLAAYRPDGSLIGYVQNGGGSRYGGTVMGYQPYDPVTVTIRSSSGGSISVPTTPFIQ